MNCRYSFKMYCRVAQKKKPGSTGLEAVTGAAVGHGAQPQKKQGSAQIVVRVRILIDAWHRTGRWKLCTP